MWNRLGGGNLISYIDSTPIKKMGEGGRSPVFHIKQVKQCDLACKTYSDGSVTHFCIFAIWSHKFSLHVLTVSTYFTIMSTSDPQTLKSDLLVPSEPFSMIIVGFGIHKNVSTSDPFDQDLVSILDSSKCFSD